MTIEKIAVNGHYVWVDKDVEIKEGDHYYVNNSLGKRIENILPYPSGFVAKIIAASPELNLKRVPSYARYKALEYSKPIEKEVEDESSYDWCLGAYQGFEEGYKAAEKEKSDELLTKYQEGMAKGLELCKELYTEDDVRKAIAIGFDWCHQKQLPTDYMIDEFIKQLKQGGNK